MCARDCSHAHWDTCPDIPLGLDKVEDLLRARTCESEASRLGSLREISPDTAHAGGDDALKGGGVFPTGP